MTADKRAAIRHTWGPGLLLWCLAFNLIMIMTGLVMEDIHRFSWWLVGPQVLGFGGYSFAILTSAAWRITAAPEGLRVRTALRARTVPWEDLTRAEAKVGSLILTRRGGKRVTVGYTVFRRVRPMAAEITTLIREPALRPIV